MSFSTRAISAPGASPVAADPRPILFLHVPKCAGTSVVTMFSNMAGEAHCRRLHLTTLDATNRDIAECFGPETKHLAFISGHIQYGFFAPHERNFRLFTMLRDPVARVTSLFRFLRRAPDLAARGLPEKFTFADMLASTSGSVFPGVDNAMCRMLSRKLRFHDEAAPEPWRLETHAYVLEEALATLRESVFGLAERMAQSCALVRHEFGIPYEISAAALNTTNPNGSVDEARFAPQIRARNQLDLVLYARAKTMFAERLAAIAGPPRHTGADAAHLVFRPALDVPVQCPNVPGRQGFHEDFDGISWIIAHQTARLHFVAPAAACRLFTVVYSLAPDYPVERISLRVNGQPVRFRVVPGAAHWFELRSETLQLDEGLNVLTISPPLVLPVRELLPENGDDRHLSVGIASFRFVESSWPALPEAPSPPGVSQAQSLFVRLQERRSFLKKDSPPGEAKNVFESRPLD